MTIHHSPDCARRKSGAHTLNYSVFGLQRFVFMDPGLAAHFMCAAPGIGER